MKKVLLLLFFLSLISEAFGQGLKDMLQNAQSTQKKILISVKLPQTESFLPLPIFTLDSPCLSTFIDSDCNLKLDSLFINGYFELGSTELEELKDEVITIEGPNHYIFDDSGDLIIRISGSKLGNLIVTDSLLKVLGTIKGVERLKSINNLGNITSVWKLEEKIDYINSIGLVDRHLFKVFSDSLMKPEYSDALGDFHIRNVALNNLQFIHHEFEKNIVSRFLTAAYDSNNYDDIVQRDNFLKVYTSFMSSLEYSNHMNDFKMGDELFSFIDSLSGNDEKFSLSFSVPEATLLSGSKNMKFHYYSKTGQYQKLFVVSKAIADELIDSLLKDSILAESVAEGLNTLSWSFYELKIEDKEILNDVIKWINKAIELTPENPAYLDTKAHILYLLGNKGDALDVQKRAIEILENLADDSYLKMMYSEIIRSNFEKLKSGEF